MRLMLDSMIFDRIAATPGLTEQLNALHDAGRLRVLTTHVQEDQLRKIPDAAKRAAVARVKREVEPTSDFVIGVSRIGMARLGNGAVLEQIRSGRHSNETFDALIAATAGRYADVLVTEDRKFARRAARAGLKGRIWDFARLEEHIAAA